MADAPAQVNIPNRALFKALEVCDIVKVQPYVLRTWEAEFPELGVAKTTGGPRVYRRADVEQVVRIKHLLLVEGLTLAGARRKLVDEAAPVAADEPAFDELIGQNARERLTAVKRGLRSILEMLSSTGVEPFSLAAPVVMPVASRPRPTSSSSRRAKPAHGGKASASRNGSSRSTSTRRKRPA